MCKMGIIIGPNLSVGRKIKLTIWGNITVLAKCECVRAKLLQSCPALCDPMDCSPLGSSVRGISQARILEWVAIFFSRGSSLPQIRTQVSCIAGRIFTIGTTREAQET